MIRRLHVPVLSPRDVIFHLAKQEAHWRAGYSAQELAVAWVDAGGDFPKRVRAVLDTVSEYQRAELVDGFFEREVELGTAGRNSQTDLMVVAGLGRELSIIAVEGRPTNHSGSWSLSGTPHQESRPDLKACAAPWV